MIMMMSPAQSIEVASLNLLLIVPKCMHSFVVASSKQRKVADVVASLAHLFLLWWYDESPRDNDVDAAQLHLHSSNTHLEGIASSSAARNRLAARGSATESTKNNASVICKEEWLYWFFGREMLCVPGNSNLRQQLPPVPLSINIWWAWIGPRVLAQAR